MNSMRKHLLVGLLSLLVVATASLTVAPRAEAGVSQAVMALAGPLAEKFGVPSASVSSLLEGGMSLESVTKLLLVSRDSSSSLDSVTKLFNESGKDIDKTAEKLDVDPKRHSDKKAKKKAAAAATDQANEAETGAADGASKAVAAATERARGAMDSALGTLGD
jgi:hypothetical protein